METSLSWLGRLVETPGGAEWQRLSEVYQPLIHVWATRAGVASEDVDDVVQEVLIVVIERVSEFEHQGPGAFRGWLRAILSNQLKKYFRQNLRQHCQIPLESICDNRSSDSRLIDREHDEYLAALAMDQIKSEFQPATWSAFWLQVIEQHRPLDVAAQLGMSANAVIKAKCRVLKRLRETLADLLEE